MIPPIGLSNIGLGTHQQWEWQGRSTSQTRMCHLRPYTHSSSLQASGFPNNVVALLSSETTWPASHSQAASVSQCGNSVSTLLECSSNDRPLQTNAVVQVVPAED